MSWGYWGIVTGLLVLVTVFFFTIDLFYRGKKTLPTSTHRISAAQRMKPDRGMPPSRRHQAACS